MDTLIVTFVAGVLAAGSPCVVVLVPLTLYRFRGGTGDDVGWPFAAFLAGFMLSYAGFAVLAAELLASAAQNGFKAGLGGVFALVGILCLSGYVNPLHLPIVRNPFLVGVGFALLVSVNPCTLPFLGMLMTTQQGPAMFGTLLVFALGLVTPAVLFVCFGKLSLSAFKKQGLLLSRMTSLMNIALVVTGLYLITQVTLFTLADVLVAEALVFTFLLVLSYTTLHWVSLFARLLVGVAVALPLLAFHWISHAQDLHDAFAKASDSQKCPANEVLQTCLGCGMFSHIFASAVLLACGFVLLLRYWQRDERVAAGKGASPVLSPWMATLPSDHYALKLATQLRRQAIIANLPS